MNDTVKIYDQMADEYADIAEDLPSTLKSFLRGLAPKSNVLDLGCGPGHHSRIMADKGHCVLAVDASSEMIKRANAQPGVTALQASFDDITGLGTFNGIWASFSLLHAPRAKVPSYIRDLKSISAPGALVSISLKSGQGESVDSLGRHYSYFSDEELSEYLTNAGFRIGKKESGTVAGMAGKVEPWIGIEAHA